MTEGRRTSPTGVAETTAARELKRPYEAALAKIQQGLARTSAMNVLGRDAEAVRSAAARQMVDCEAVRTSFAADVAVAPVAVRMHSIVRDFERALDEAERQAKLFLRVDERVGEQVPVRGNLHQDQLAAPRSLLTSGRVP